jgi:hypothetical protein
MRIEWKRIDGYTATEIMRVGPKGHAKIQGDK